MTPGADTVSTWVRRGLRTFRVSRSRSPFAEDRLQVDRHLLDQIRSELPSHLGPAGERDVPSSCRGPCLIERRHDAIGDEGERRAPDAAVVRGQVRQHENRVMVRRVGTPPAVPRIVPQVRFHRRTCRAPSRSRRCWPSMPRSRLCRVTDQNRTIPGLKQVERSQEACGPDYP